MCVYLPLSHEVGSAQLIIVSNSNAVQATAYILRPTYLTLTLVRAYTRNKITKMFLVRIGLLKGR